VPTLPPAPGWLPVPLWPPPRELEDSPEFECEPPPEELPALPELLEPEEWLLPELLLELVLELELLLLELELELEELDEWELLPL
jgi:hypothetical protein